MGEAQSNEEHKCSRGRRAAGEETKAKHIVTLTFRCI